MKSTFIMLLRENAIRDAQMAVCASPDAEVLDDDAWRDVSEPMYLGTYSGTKEEAIRYGANYAGTDEYNIAVLDVASLVPRNA